MYTEVVLTYVLAYKKMNRLRDSDTMFHEIVVLVETKCCESGESHHIVHVFCVIYYTFPNL